MPGQGRFRLSPWAGALILLSIIQSGPDSAASAQPPPEDYLTSLIVEARNLKLSERRYWHLLLHYHKRWNGGFASEADGKEFFISPDGKYRPDAELEATIASFFVPFSDDPEAQHPQCRFPARFAWLKEELNFDSRLPLARCDKFYAWRSRLKPESATVIFADAYLANPPSMYGHTFIRLNRNAQRREERLLDYTINFSADTNTRNGIVFAIRGLMGAYPGRFSTTPYYIKVQEYSNLESRDLWEYHLSLTPEQLDRLVMHLWELGSTYFDYYFLTQNCSYQLLPLIEIADPDLDLSTSIKPWIIPIDTIRTLLKQPGLVTGVERRPSHMNKMLDERARLSSDEVTVAEAVSRRMDAQATSDLDQYPSSRKGLILNAAYDYFRYREGFLYDQSPESKKLERRILLARTQLGIQPTNPQEIARGTPPDSGHKSGLMALRFGSTRDFTFEEIAIRPALHDLVADQTGYLPNSQLEMFHLRLRYSNEDRNAYLEELALLKIFSLSPMDRWIRKPSWRVAFGMSAVNDLPFRYRSVADLDGGLGIAFGRLREAWYILAEAQAQYGEVLDEKHRAGVGGTSGVVLDITPKSRAHGFATYRTFLLGDRSSDFFTNIEFRYSLSKDWDVRANWRWRQRQSEILLGVSSYF